MDISASDPSSTGSEALSLLRDAAERAGAGTLAGQLAERALCVTERADFAVAQDALHALLRRLAAARDAGAVLSGPRNRVLGWYRVGRRGREAPLYHVLLTSLEPLGGSCSCPDFAKASLGLCAHLFRVAEGRAGRGPALARPPLVWDPVRPLTGPGDWLERVTWRDASAATTGPESRARRLFRGGDPERPALPPGVLSEPSARLAAVEALAAAVRARDRLADPAILPLLERERRELRRMLAGAMAPREVRRHCDGLKQKLFLYQREGVRRFLERGRLVLADDMGLGKTAQAIAACHVLVASGRVRRGLIVVPAPLKSQWQREWQRFTDVPLTVVEGRLDERWRKAGRAGAAMLLVDYEQLLRDVPQLLRFRPEIAVLDEAQRLKYRATETAAHLERLDPRWRLVLTGTPMENRLDELASLIEWVDESALEPRWRLTSWHPTWDAERRAVGSARNLETLRQRLAPAVVRRVRRDVIEQLPARRDTRLSVPLTPGQRAAHDEVQQPIARILGQAARRPLDRAEFLRLMSLLTHQRIVCNGLAHADFPEVWPAIERRRPTPALLESLASPKLAELRELIAAIAVEQGRKVVVFSGWRRMLKLAGWAVADVLRTAGVRAVFSSGEEDARRRGQNVDDFRQDDGVRVLLATDAGGVGRGTRGTASCCIHLDLPWNPAILEQRIGRVYRPGQKHPVDVYAMVAEDGIENRIAALVGDKQALSSGLFDGASDAIELERAGSFLARLNAVRATPRGAADSEVGDVDDREGGPERVVGEEDDTIEDGVAAVDAGPVDGAGGAGSAATPAGIGSILGQIQVKQLSDGRVSFEAPAAAALGELLHATAQLFRSGDRATSSGE